MGWKDQYQPLPVIPSVAMATDGVSGEGQHAAHLCLSLPTLGSKRPNVICCVHTAASVRSRLESMTDCYRPKHPGKMTVGFHF